MRTFNVNPMFQVPEQRVKDLLVSAFEGGSNYWIESVEKINTKGGRVQGQYLSDVPLIEGQELKFSVVEDLKDVTPFSYILNITTIQRGLEIMAKDEPRHWNDFLSANDDAITADVFLQCCLFSKTIFG